MNKLSMVFAALRAYREARGQEGSTVRGVVTGLLAAGAIVGLGFMGADLSAEQIGLVLAAISGIDAVLKIVLPDDMGGPSRETNAAQTRAERDPAGLGASATRGVDGVQRLPADGGAFARRDSDDGRGSGWNG